MQSLNFIDQSAHVYFTNTSNSSNIYTGTDLCTGPEIIQFVLISGLFQSDFFFYSRYRDN